jgi:NADH-quinone oxidoreductase subunit M
MSTFPWLTVMGAVPLAGALVIAAIPGGTEGTPSGLAEPGPAGNIPPGDVLSGPGGAPANSATHESRDLLYKRLALVFTLATLAVAIVVALRFKPGGPQFQFTETYSWIPQFGVHYAVGVDGIALVLVLMSVVLMPVVVLASWNDADPAGGARRSVKTYFSLMLVLETMIIGVFVATDVFLFYVFFEAMLIPMYFMIGSFGVGQRQYAAVKFLLYSLLGGLLMLVAVIALYVYSTRGGAAGTFLFTSLTHLPLSLAAQKWLFLGFFIAFAIKAPLWPFHTWLPDAATAAQPGAAVLLVGVLDKVGTFGMLRYSLELFPAGARYFTPLVITLAVIGILYGAIVAIGQTDMKRLIAYTSVSHFGFIALGIFVLTTQGQSGATLYMVNHGFATGALFLIAGFLISRRGSQRIADYGGVQKVAPIMAGLFLVAGLATLSLPGLSTFVSEFLVLVGTFTRYKVPAVLATLGMILAAIYILWMYQRTMNGPARDGVKGMPDLKARELWAVGPLIALIIALGVYPQPVLKIINPAVRDTMTQVHATDPPPTVSTPAGTTAVKGATP